VLAYVHHSRFGGSRVFFIQLLGSNPLVYLIALAALLFSLVLHNIAQAFAAASAGDSTAKLRGFTSTEPQRHLNTFSLIYTVLFGFGIPTQIPVMSRNIRGRGGPEALVWLAGPLGMIGFAFLLLIVSSLTQRFAPGDLSVVANGLSTAAFFVVQIAVVFLFPVPPMAGASALAAVGGQGAREFLRTLEGFMQRLYPFGFMLVFIVLSFTGVLGFVTGIVLNLLLGVLSLIGL
jgi:hypothetical protein